MERSIARLGMSAVIRDVEEEIAVAARTEARVLLTGESGVGKEFIARLIHDRGARAGAPLIHVRCAGSVSGRLEDELFGPPRLADARDASGRLAAADHGTVFLDEIGETSQHVQARLLRFIEDGEVAQGPGRRRRVDVRLIASTSGQLTDRIGARTFRHDLYYRLNVVHIAVPPLRERPEDIVVLMNDFLRFFASASGVSSPELTADAWERLTEYPWPGNVRQLRHVAKRLIRHHGGGRVSVNELPGELWLQPADAPERAGAACRATRPLSCCLLERMIDDRVSFRCDGRAFDARTLTRDALRQLVRLGFEHTRAH